MNPIVNLVNKRWPKFVCLFKGGVIVLHSCLANRVHICRVPHSFDPTPRPKGPVLSEGNMNPAKDLNRIDLPCCP